MVLRAVPGAGLRVARPGDQRGDGTPDDAEPCVPKGLRAARSGRHVRRGGPWNRAVPPGAGRRARRCPLRAGAEIDGRRQRREETGARVVVQPNAGTAVPCASSHQMRHTVLAWAAESARPSTTASTQNPITIRGRTVRVTPL